jgi:hypothetical protein
MSAISVGNGERSFSGDLQSIGLRAIWRERNLRGSAVSVSLYAWPPLR